MAHEPNTNDLHKIALKPRRLEAHGFAMAEIRKINDRLDFKQYWGIGIFTRENPVQTSATHSTSSWKA